MGVTGSDLMLSPTAQDIFPFKVECKNNKAIAVYRHFEQASAGCPPWLNPLVVIKENNAKPLAIVDLDLFMFLLRENYVNQELRKERERGL